MTTVGRTNRGEKALCPSRRHRAEAVPTRAVPGLRICAACRDTVEEELIALPSLFELSANALDARRLRKRVSGRPPRLIVLREVVVSLRSDAISMLAVWAGLVAGERGVPGPDLLDIRKLTRFLAIHLHWLCQHPAAARLVDDLADLSVAIAEAFEPDTGFRVAIGLCPRPDCDRIVHAEAHREGEEPYEVSCGAGHVWAPEHWLSSRGRANGESRGKAPRPSPEGQE